MSVLSSVSYGYHKFVAFVSLDFEFLVFRVNFACLEEKVC